MSDGKLHRPKVSAAPEPPAQQPTELPKIFRSVDASRVLGPGRMDGVHGERQEASSQIQRTLKAWRAASGDAGMASVPKTTGNPLGSTVKSQMERKLGADL